MAEISNNREASSLSLGRWTGLVVAAVILAEGVWGFLVSVTNNLLLPLMARGMAVDPQSPLYLGKGDFNVPGLFSSVIELCLAGILFLLLKHWAGKGSATVPVRTVKKVAISQPAARSLSISPEPARPVAPAPASVAHASPPAAQPPAAQAAPPAPMQVQPPPPQPAPQPQAVSSKTVTPPAAKPEKPKKPKEVYYNIVGEPINLDDD